MRWGCRIVLMDGAETPLKLIVSAGNNHKERGGLNEDIATVHEQLYADKRNKFAHIVVVSSRDAKCYTGCWDAVGHIHPSQII